MPNSPWGKRTAMFAIDLCGYEFQNISQLLHFDDYRLWCSLKNRVHEGIYYIIQNGNLTEFLRHVNRELFIGSKIGLLIKGISPFVSKTHRVKISQYKASEQTFGKSI